VIGVFQGKRRAESALKEFQDSQSPADHHEGWRYFFEKTELAAGTDPAEATHLRQADLESREAKESQGTESTLRPSSNLPNDTHRGFPRK
jgi:hypothetical protein